MKEELLRKRLVKDRVFLYKIYNTSDFKEIKVLVKEATPHQTITILHYLHKLVTGKVLFSSENYAQIVKQKRIFKLRRGVESKVSLRNRIKDKESRIQFLLDISSILPICFKPLFEKKKQINMDDEVTEMVLLNYNDYLKLKKRTCDCSKNIPSNDSDIKNTEGHGVDLPKSIPENSYQVDLPKSLPEKYVQPNNVFEAIEMNSSLLSLVPSVHKQNAKYLLEDLQKKKSITWNKEGNLTIREKQIASDLKTLLNKVFTGVRKGEISGESEFINFLNEENLSHYIKSAPKDWFYIGKP